MKSPFAVRFKNQIRIRETLHCVLTFQHLFRPCSISKVVNISEREFHLSHDGGLKFPQKKKNIRLKHTKFSQFSKFLENTHNTLNSPGSCSLSFKLNVLIL